MGEGIHLAVVGKVLIYVIEIRRSYQFRVFFSSMLTVAAVRGGVLDREGCGDRATDNIAVRPGRQLVRLVRQHGTHHEGAGLPEGQRPQQPVSDATSL